MSSSVQRPGDQLTAGYLARPNDHFAAGYLARPGDHFTAGYLARPGDHFTAGYLARPDDQFTAGYLARLCHVHWTGHRCVHRRTRLTGGPQPHLPGQGSSISIHSVVYRMVSTHGHISRADNNSIFTARRNARIPSAVLATAIPSAFVQH